MREVDFEVTQCSKSNIQPSQIARCLSNQTSLLKEGSLENNCSNVDRLTSDVQPSLEQSTVLKIQDHVPTLHSPTTGQADDEPLITSPEPQGSSPEPNVIKEDAFSRVDEMVDSRSWNADSPLDQSIKANEVSPVLTPYSSRRVSSTQLEILEELRSAVGTALEEWNKFPTDSTNSTPVHTSKLSNWNEFCKLLELLKERRFDTEVSFQTQQESIIKFHCF